MTQRNRLSFVHEKSDSIINSTQLRTRTHQIIRLTHLAIRVDNCQLSSWKLLGLNEFEVQTLASLNLRRSFWLVDSSKKVRDLRGSAAKINPTLSTILLSVCSHWSCIYEFDSMNLDMRNWYFIFKWQQWQLKVDKGEAPSYGPWPN